MPDLSELQNRAVVLQQQGEPTTIERRPIPSPGSGSVVVRVLAASVRANSPDVYRNSQSGHQLPLPCVPGFYAIARVFGLGPDATRLKPGQLVFFDPYIQGRDRGGLYISGMMEGFDEGSLKLSRGEWRDSTYADYTKVPLENCHPLNEQRLLGRIERGGLGYSIEDLCHLFSMAIPFGGLADIDVKSGDTVIIAPSTGRYGSAAVQLAIAMGAHVVAIGRNGNILSQLAATNKRISTVQLQGDVELDTIALRQACRGLADAFWDMSPSAAATSTHFKSCLNALGHGSRVSLVGRVLSGVDFSYMDILGRGLTIKGTWMSTPEQTQRLIKMAEIGLLPLDEAAGMGPVNKFRLEQFEEALDMATHRTEPGEIIIAP
ncbi:L-threonine 3-dehydrogenase [Colletotrichum trifolii]|uniref:L-threonine 3-dehydrogenase n=1 Tax=Colletotrichum trifolii TaxID=5466 RepID=A0A4R8QBT1_COLTR|nr:L-threonine 3-dehydrogenase [Colletotrichum trifolii]